MTELERAKELLRRWLEHDMAWMAASEHPLTPVKDFATPAVCKVSYDTRDFLGEDEVPHRLVSTVSDPATSGVTLTCKCGREFATLHEMRKHREKENMAWVRADKPTDAEATVRSMILYGIASTGADYVRPGADVGPLIDAIYREITAQPVVWALGVLSADKATVTQNSVVPE